MSETPTAREWRLRNRDYVLRCKGEWDSRNRAMITTPRRGHWTPDEDAVVLRDDITIREMCGLLQRSYSAISTRRAALTTAQPGTCDHCGVSFPRVRPSRSQRPFHSRGKFCSRGCAYASVKVATTERKRRHCRQCAIEYVPKFDASKYCSRECFALGITKYPPIPCPECSATFKPQVTFSTKYGTTQTRYCSMACAGQAKRRRTRAQRTRDCLQCGNEFVAKDPRTRLCSRECVHLNHRSRVEIDCETCGKSFRSGNGRFCSMACRSATRLQDCKHCGQQYTRYSPAQQFCSRSCATTVANLNRYRRAS